MEVLRANQEQQHDVQCCVCGLSRRAGQTLSADGVHAGMGMSAWTRAMTRLLIHENGEKRAT